MKAAGRVRLIVQYADGTCTPLRAQIRRWVMSAHAVLEAQAPAELTVRIVDGREARHLNRTYRQRDYATNVLTFCYQDSEEVRADIILCRPVIAREARQQKKDLHAHFAHLVVHGVLHAHGLDHETARQAHDMERLETLILARFRLPDPYA